MDSCWWRCVCVSVCTLTILSENASESSEVNTEQCSHDCSDWWRRKNLEPRKLPPNGKREDLINERTNEATRGTDTAETQWHRKWRRKWRLWALRAGTRGKEDEGNGARERQVRESWLETEKPLPFTREEGEREWKKERKMEERKKE